MADVKSLASKFNQKPVVMGFAKPDPGPVSIPNQDTPVTQDENKSKQFGGVPVMGIGARSNLKPVVAKKPPDGVKPTPPVKKSMVVLPDTKKTAIVPPLFKKPLHSDKQNGHIVPSTMPKPGPAVPTRGAKETKVDQGSDPQKDNKDQSNHDTFSALRDRFAKANTNNTGPPIQMQPQTTKILRQKEPVTSIKSIQKELESTIKMNANKTESGKESVDDPIYTDAVGKKYKMLPMPEVSGTPPMKPRLPAHCDLYEFQVTVAEDDDLYESYDDVIAPGSAPRPVSMIPTMTEEEEGERRGSFQQDGRGTPQDRKNKSVSLIDEEFYEDFDEMGLN